MSLVMKPKTFNPKKHTIPKYGQLKLDGHRVTVRRYSFEDIRVLTTRAHDIASKLKAYPFWEFVERMAVGASMECELISPGRHASQVKTAVKNGDPVELWPFAYDFLPAHAQLREVRLELAKLGFKSPEFWHNDCHEDPIEYGMGLAKQKRCEGIVLKSANYLNWLKVKEERTIDLVVTGIKPGRGKYIGLVGSLICSTAEGHEVCNASGMADIDRYAMDESDIGRVVEIEYQKVESNGRLRHPRFIRFRDDEKSGDECTVDQDPDLEDYYNSTRESE